MVDMLVLHNRKICVKRCMGWRDVTRLAGRERHRQCAPGNLTVSWLFTDLTLGAAAATDPAKAICEASGTDPLSATAPAFALTPISETCRPFVRSSARRTERTVCRFSARIAAFDEVVAGAAAGASLTCANALHVNKAAHDARIVKPLESRILMPHVKNEE
ncbi:hypothetical protein P3T23_005099 [Paraburkholderia sp. GAS448]|uniref:hypothetical protein n=1 Tax=Paraburkholderia sp. GAS448 TaxID=3035136 RepID=UPI003D2545B7